MIYDIDPLFQGPRNEALHRQFNLYNHSETHGLVLHNQMEAKSVNYREARLHFKSFMADLGRTRTTS